MSDFETFHVLSSHILAATSSHRGGWRALIVCVPGENHDIEAYDVRRYGVTLDERTACAIFNGPRFDEAEYTG